MVTMYHVLSHLVYEKHHVLPVRVARQSLGRTVRDNADGFP